MTALPYVRAAFVCERLLEEKDNVLSVVRIVDNINAEFEGEPPTEPLVVSMTLFVSLIAGDTQGPGQFRITLTAPDGSSLLNATDAIGIDFVAGSAAPVSIKSPVLFPAATDGTYWFNILLDEVVITRVPLSVSRRQREATDRSKSPESASP